MIKARRFSAQDELTTFLHGGLIGGAQLVDTQLYGLHGLTLEFTSPAVETVTFDFTGVEQASTTVLVVKAQIETQTTGVLCRFYKGRLVLVESSPSLGIALGATGTANSLLGFDAEGSEGALIQSDGATKPYLVDIVQCPFAGGGLLVLVEES